MNADQLELLRRQAYGRAGVPQQGRDGGQADRHLEQRDRDSEAVVVIEHLLRLAVQGGGLLVEPLRLGHQLVLAR